MPPNEIELQEDSIEMSFAEIWKMIASEDTIILVLPAMEIPKLQKGLSNIKFREAEKIRNEGLAPDERKLSFEIMMKKPGDNIPSDCERLRVSLAEQNSVLIHHIETLLGSGEKL